MAALGQAPGALDRSDVNLMNIQQGGRALYHTLMNIQQPEGNCGDVYCGLAAKWVL